MVRVEGVGNFGETFWKFHINDSAIVVFISSDYETATLVKHFDKYNCPLLFLSGILTAFERCLPLVQARKRRINSILVPLYAWKVENLGKQYFKGNE